MSRDRLIIIGAGPKAMAVGAKTRVLEELGFTVPEIHVVERREIGAHWSGRNGYTNGRQPLGTPPEKDLGYPYDSSSWGPELGREIDARMMKYAWQSFMVARGDFSDWVDRGKPAPSHCDWAQYLKWVAASLGDSLTVHTGEVTSISIGDGVWRVRVDGTGPREVEGEGLVLTGPGPVRRPENIPDHPRILTVESFWKGADDFRALTEGKVAIVGTGETAAAIAVNLVEMCSSRVDIDIYSPLGMAYSRGESFRENCVYSDPARGQWGMLTPQHRRDFIHRTDRGVFSQGSNEVLDRARNLQILPGRLMGATLDRSGRVSIDVAYDGRNRVDLVEYLILATGSDMLAPLVDLADEGTRGQLLQATGVDQLLQDRLENLIDYDLGVRGLSPRLHLPMISGLNQGPGFANLSCLGRLSDRILEYYATFPLEKGASARGEAAGQPERIQVSRSC